MNELIDIPADRKLKINIAQGGGFVDKKIKPAELRWSVIVVETEILNLCELIFF